MRVSAGQTNSRGHSTQNNGGLKTKETMMRQQQYETLLDLYGDNYCACAENDCCKKILQEKFKCLVKSPLSSPLLREFTQIITGSKVKSAANMFRTFLRYIENNGNEMN